MVRDRWKRWSLRSALFASVLVSLLAVVGAVYQTIGSRGESRAFRHPGQLVSVGKFRLNLYCAGHGSPTVVLESGWGDSLDSLSRVQPEISRFARVCSYD